MALIERMYLGDGWYMDGKTTQRDYYISFAFSYYSLIYVKFMRERILFVRNVLQNEPLCSRRTICTILMRRAKRYLYGRSQTYRFAQGAFFPALIFAEVEALPLGTNKNVVSKHLLFGCNRLFSLMMVGCPLAIITKI